MITLKSVLPRVVSALVMPIAAAALLSVQGSAPAYGQSEQAVTGNVPSAYPGVKRIVAQVSANNLAILKGNTRPEARAEFDRGAVAADFPMKGMLLVLRRSAEQQAAFDAFVQSEYETGSPDYHRWLTPEEVGEKFGPAQEDIDTISQWLTSQGFTVDEVTKDRMTIRFSGTAGQVKSAFHTEIHHLSVKGENHIANMSDPAIPAALTPVVVGVQALHNFFPRPMHRLGGQVRMDAETHSWKRVENASVAGGKATGADQRAAAMGLKPDFGTGGTTDGEANIEDVAPYDFATIYNVLPLWQAATPITGAGQTIAIVATSNINLADVTAFRSAFGLPAYPSNPNPNLNQPGVSVVIPPSTTDPGDCPGASSSSSTCAGDLIEDSLDVEWAGSVATGAHIILVASSPGSGSDYTSDPVWISASYIVNKDLAPIMNVSYGECELGLGTAGNAGYNTLWQTAASEGIAVFVAAGDEGSASCDAGLDTSVPYGAQFGLSVSGVASTPYDTAVGGTDFNWSWTNGVQSTYWNSSNNTTTQASAKGYIPEFPWNSTCTNPLYDALVNNELKTSYDASTICSDLASGAISSSAGDFLVDIVGGSGGVSACTTNDGADVSSCSGGYAKPSWQAGVTGIPSDGKRDIPDVSFFASNGFSGSAYLFCASAIVPGGSCTYSSTTEPTYSEVGGTSVASPAMAGVMALLNQKNGSAFGSPNMKLYQLAAKETYSGCSTESVGVTGSSCTFYDIDTGTIAMPCDAGSTNCVSDSGEAYGVLSGYLSTAGYDLASGLGSLNVANLAASFGPLASTSSSSLKFAATLDGTSSAPQQVTLSNPGTAALSITKIGFTGTNASAFSETDNCGTSVAVGSSCTINVVFSPTAAGAYSASLSITDNASGSPQTITLTGAGVAPAPAVGFSSGSLTFAALVVGETSTPQSVTLTNTGTASLIVSSVGITGTNATSFSVDTASTNCVGTVLVGKSCTISVTFAPQAFGQLSAAVSVTDNASGSPQSVTLSGTGAEPSGSSYSLSATSVSVTAGSSGSSTVTATGSNGYVGPTTVTINSCKLASSPTGAVDLPTCSISGATISFAAGASTGSGGSVNIQTTGASSAARRSAVDVHNPLRRWTATGGAALAFMLLLGVPARRKNWRSMLGLILLAGALTALSACGGGGSSGGGGNPGTTTGSYTFTVNGTDAVGTSQSTTLNVTVN